MSTDNNNIQENKLKDEFSSGSGSEEIESETEAYYKTIQGQKLMHLDSFSSDDEEVENTVGDIPMKWYEKYDHIGYSLDGEKIEKPEAQDEMMKMISRVDDPAYKWTLYDEKNGKTFTISSRELELIKNIQQGKYPHPEFNDETPYDDTYSSDVSKVPISGVPLHKRSFLPSKWEVIILFLLIDTKSEQNGERNKIWKN